MFLNNYMCIKELICPSVLYLLNFLVGWYRCIYVTLVPEPRANSLQRPISTAPTAVINAILHIVMIAVCTVY